LLADNVLPDDLIAVIADRSTSNEKARQFDGRLHLWYDNFPGHYNGLFLQKNLIALDECADFDLLFPKLEKTHMQV
jgi:hypothetical protein